MKTKVFGIGLPKTGTTSLTAFLEKQGLRTLHNPLPFRNRVYNHADFSLDGVEWDAITNFAEWFFPHIDRAFPGSRFILTRRDRDAWLTCCQRNFNAPPSSELQRLTRINIFGIPHFDRAQFADVYDSHGAYVRDYFARSGRQADLFEVHLENVSAFPDLTDSLCRFVDGDAPGAAYPWRNKTPESRR